MTTRRPRVLLADDHPSLLTALKRLLAPDCDVVGSVTDGAAALAETTRLQPDVVVLDVFMPGLDGLEVCRAITHTNPTIYRPQWSCRKIRLPRRPQVPLRGPSHCPNHTCLFVSFII